MQKASTISLVSSLFISVALVSCGTTSDKPRLATGGISDVHSQSAANLYQKAENLASARKNSAAIKTYKKVADDYPLSTQAAPARYKQATLLYQNRDLVKSFDVYQEFIEDHKGSSLYSTAIEKQTEVALAAASGKLKNSFLGLKTKIAAATSNKMLIKVRDNAPYASTAPKAQFAVGELWQNRGIIDKSIAGYKEVQRRYPDSGLAPEAIYRVGSLLMQQINTGDRNKASIDKARNVFLDLRQKYPNHKRSKDAKAKLAQLSSKQVTGSYEIAEYYRERGQTASAIYYYRDVLKKVKSGPLHNKAKARLAELGQ